MSTRLKRARKASNKPDYSQQIELDLSGSSSEEEEESDQEEKVSKRKNSKKGGKKGEGKNSKERKGKGSKGKGKAKKEVDKVKVDPLDQLPFELVSEILSQLTPKDLLNFSRTNRQYRSILMSKNRSNSIWKSSRRKIGLPDLTAEDFSEPAYAALVFDTHCQHCDRYAPAWVDYVLRLRLCKPCRSDHIVKINPQFEKEKRFHPATLSCVTKTPIGLEKSRWYGRFDKKWVLSSDLDYYHKRLSTLQEDDEFDETLETPISPSVNHNPRRRSKQKRVSYREKDEEEEDEVMIREGGRVEKFVAERKEALVKIYADGEAIAQVCRAVLAKVKSEEQRLRSSTWSASYGQQQGLQADLSNRLALVNGYSRADVYLLTKRFRNSVVEPGQNITNEIWTSIESKVLAAIDKAKLKNASDRKKEKLLAAEQNRKKSLKKYYNDLKNQTGDKLYFPLFIDFIQLSAVKPLWQAQDEEDDEEETIDESTWKLLLPLIRNDLEDSHVELVSSSIRLILSTYHDYETDEELEDAIQEVLEGDLDSFFSLASSLVMCGGGCRSQQKLVQVPRWGGRFIGRWKKHGGFVGSVPQVVAHLLQDHNGTYSYSTSKASKRRSEPIILPLEVAAAISAVLEVGQLDESIATVEDLNQLDRGHYRLDNSKSNKKNFNTWRDLVNQVSLASHKAERARPPYHLDPPLVIYYPSSLPPPPPASDFDEQNSSSEASPKNAVRKEDDSSEIEGSDEETFSNKRRKLKYTSDEEEDEDELDSE